ncbi:MAG: hypothetical protein AAFX08_09165 [Pseudomonadota bacterium]
MLKVLTRYAPHGYALFAAAVFTDSLRFKFTNQPETQVIFGKLDAWAATIGAPGLFAQTGLFSQYVIGTAELFAAAFLVIGILSRFRRLQAVGALIALAIMTGALSFHLFTPLGVDPNNDGGGLFAIAVAIWLGSIAMLAARFRDAAAIFGGMLSIFHTPSRSAQSDVSLAPLAAQAAE